MRLTPELTRREESDQASEFSMKAALIPLASNELFGGERVLTVCASVTSIPPGAKRPPFPTTLNSVSVRRATARGRNEPCALTRSALVCVGYRQLSALRRAASSRSSVLKLQGVRFTRRRRTLDFSGFLPYATLIDENVAGRKSAARTCWAAAWGNGAPSA